MAEVCWHGAALSSPLARRDESPDALLRRLEQGHWFLKHRAKGDKPHKRFVYCDGPAIYWASREDRTGKLGCLKAVGELIVVPGLASAVLFGKVRLRDRQNRLFSLVSAERSLDLEVGSASDPNPKPSPNPSPNPDPNPDPAPSPTPNPSLDSKP